MKLNIFREAKNVPESKCWIFLFWTVMHKNMFLCFVFFFFLLLRVGNDKEETEISHTELQLYSYTKCVGVWHEIFKSFSHSQDSESLESSVFICSFTAEVFSPLCTFYFQWWWFVLLHSVWADKKQWSKSSFFLIYPVIFSP